MRHKAQMEIDKKESKNVMRDIANERVLRKSITRSHEIPNMSDAYRKVCESGHTPSEEEIHFRRFTSGSYVDGTKND